MKEAFDLIKERLEREYLGKPVPEEFRNGIVKAIRIVSEVEAEYINKSTEHINKLSDCSTNADRIRAMSDEELAEFLPIVSNCLCRPTDKCMNTICNRGECEKTKECALGWLKAEAKGE